jgi:pSer/pThr/pTyr-binding forkhead associated (FHA) protein/tetratricopeptide (TPR) repeat protein
MASFYILKEEKYSGNGIVKRFFYFKRETIRKSMKLFYIEGNKKGAVYELTPPGASIGREADNDIILDSEASSRYNSKLEFKDGEWFLKDLGSTNGTKLNEVKISTEILLHDGDRIKIGKEVLLFGTSPVVKPVLPETSPAPFSAISVKPAGVPADKSAVPPPKSEANREEGKSLQRLPPSNDSAENPKDGKAKALPEKRAGVTSGKMDFFQRKKEDKTERKRKRASMLFYITVIGAAVLLVLIFLLFDKIQNDAEKNKKAAKPVQSNVTPLMVSYEKQISTPDNIFRYELKIRDNTIAVTRDDLKHQIRFTREKTVDRDSLQKLEQELKETDFMNLAGQQSGVASDGTDELKLLTIAFGNNLNSIRIKNTFEPTSFKEAVNILEDFSKNILSIPTVSLTADEMKNKAGAEFRNAEMLFKNYQSKDENLRICIRKYGLVIDYLQCFEPKPDMYDKAYQRSQEAKKILDDEIKSLMSDAERNVRLAKYEDAKENYLKIKSKIDPENSQYEFARKMMIKTEELSRQKKKK